MHDSDTDAPAFVVASYAMDAPGAHAWLTSYLHAGARAVVESGRRAGLRVELLDSLRAASRPDDVAAQVAGVIVLGGADVAPQHYGHEVASDAVNALHPEADAYEINLVRAAVDRGLPVLGICRGMQLLNVAHGGTLVQDLPRPSIHTLPVDGDSVTAHEVAVTDGSLTGSIWGGPVLSVRSDHHQAIAALGQGLRPTAHASDGVIEAVELVEGWGLGVQWHPEDPGSPDGHLDALLAAFAMATAPGPSSDDVGSSRG